MTPERLAELNALSDAEFIAEARTARPELIEEVERLQAQILAVQQLLADLKKASDHHYNRNLVALRLKQALGENP